MVRHVLLLKLHDGVGAQDLAALDASFHQLLAGFPAVEGRLGRALYLPGSSGQSADYAVTLDFKGPEDFAAYIHDPRHQSFVQEVLSPLREASWSAQIEL